MQKFDFERARQKGWARSRRFFVRLARSQRLYRVLCGVPSLLILVGLVLTLLGLAAEVGQFNQGMARLIDLAGADGVVPAAAGFIQNQVVDVLGFSSPAQVEAAAAEPSPTLVPTLEIPPDPGLGFIPYQVEIGSKAQAPALPTLPVPTQPAVVTPQPQPTQAPPLQPTVAQPTATPFPPAAPERIVIPNIGLDAPVVEAPIQTVQVGSLTFEQWDAPNYFAAGWQQSSAKLGEAGNIVINGHHNIDGEVFGRLRDLAQGDEIVLESGGRAFHYRVAQVMKLKERDLPLDQRQENARWIMPSADARLTLVTCWPPANNTYRLIVVAVPVPG